MSCLILVIATAMMISGLSEGVQYIVHACASCGDPTHTPPTGGGGTSSGSQSGGHSGNNPGISPLVWISLGLLGIVGVLVMVIVLRRVNDSKMSNPTPTAQAPSVETTTEQEQG